MLSPLVRRARLTCCAGQTVQLRARSRTAVAADITIVNPLDEAISFDVQILGSGLIGEPTVHLEPKGSTVYELIYSPLVQGREQGSLTFVNDDMGEFWYALELMAEEADPISVPEIKAELGKSRKTKLLVENPVSEDIMLRVANSNPTNFKVHLDNPHDPAVFVQGYAEVAIELEYVPSSLGEEEEATITLSHPQVRHSDPNAVAPARGLVRADAEFQSSWLTACVACRLADGSFRALEEAPRRRRWN
jgi:hypothetical protein